MKFFVVLVLVAVCLPAAISAYECSGCDLDGAWRIADNTKLNNDDELIDQKFDGQVKWREEWMQFMTDYTQWVNNGKNSGSLQDQARQSCKEAIPDRVYQYRWEREIDDDEYQVRMYIYRGFEPRSDSWDRYCRLLVDEDQMSFVESNGQSIPELKGSVGWISKGLIDDIEGGNCRAIFRPKHVQQRCYVKNNKLRYPTEKFCADEQSSTPTITKHAWGGAHSHARYGCDQYTWDSDSNDDNIEQTCQRMYFVNTYNEQSLFFPGQVSGSNLVSLTSIRTPGDYCEYRVGGTGWSTFTGINPHPCQ
uniref:Uncharacterized protein n=1 Tax=Paramoeba perurans TaxID=437603 RepID=A0A8E8PJR3_9EUKA|nr:hypothetical protein [Paramoeba perurans]WQA41795.1 hypothetical protein [Paramoeba perurans]